MTLLITIFNWPPDVSTGISSAVGITIGGMILFQIIFIFLRRWGHKKKRVIPDILNRYLYVPGFVLFLAITFNVSLPFLERLIPAGFYDVLRHGLYMFVIGAAAWVVMRGVTVFREIMIRHYAQENPKDFTMRKAKTKFLLIQRVLNFIIVITAVAIALMTFESVRNVGNTMLASAGIAGLVAAFAAQKSLGSLFAGVQIAIAQPIRLDDVVVVEGEFGIISEISLTFVVLSTWDGRRLIIPINYFLENTFENWTRVSPDVVGTVKIWTDYSLPVEEVRKEFLSWVKASKLWDKRAAGFIVSDANENGIQIRGTFSAKDSDDAWDLQCQMREKLITYIQNKFPEALPKTRIMVNQNKNGKRKKGSHKPHLPNKPIPPEPNMAKPDIAKPKQSRFK